MTLIKIPAYIERYNPETECHDLADMEAFINPERVIAITAPIYSRHQKPVTTIILSNGHEMESPLSIDEIVSLLGGGTDE